MAALFPLIRPLIHCLPPETAHSLALLALRRNLLPPAPAFSSPMLEVEAFGLHFPNPVGLAAGFDKNAEAIGPLLAQGFGFVECGTVTPKPQTGNPKPRIFRLPEDGAVINRLGFNNNGLEAFVRQLRQKQSGTVGANIGKNRDSANAIDDYAAGLRAVYPYADYVTVNISSPNTEGLRDLQKGARIVELLQALHSLRRECEHLHNRRVPLLLKIAPDLSSAEQEDIAGAALAHGIDGLIISNTTVSRPDGLKSPYAREKGGLSGKPLFEPSTEMLGNFYRLTGGKLPLIGVGGISSAEDAYKKLCSGATLLQLYTALTYRGFGLVREIQSGLVNLLKRDGFTHISQVIGKDAPQ
ncbi:MAG: quinone-dependent dihydroorotate dehydrogenase [Pseudomonadota bacterium]|nr:quinone-dependent dihydroorotate dehydrogenase [Pseudomonadota bacterium]